MTETTPIQDTTLSPREIVLGSRVMNSVREAMGRTKITNSTIDAADKTNLRWLLNAVENDSQKLAAMRENPTSQSCASPATAVFVGDPAHSADADTTTRGTKLPSIRVPTQNSRFRGSAASSRLPMRSSRLSPNIDRNNSAA